MNLNPTLLMGQALAWLDKQTEERRPREHDRRYVSLRIYPHNGAGYWFVQAHSAHRWYYRDEPDAEHFHRAELSDLQAAVESGSSVQLCGVRGESYGVWRSWEEFSAAVR
jgi:hypothetical protein